MLRVVSDGPTRYDSAARGAEVREQAEVAQRSLPVVDRTVVLRWRTPIDGIPPEACPEIVFRTATEEIE